MLIGGEIFAMAEEFLFVKISWNINLMTKRGCKKKKKKEKRNIFMHANYPEQSFYGESTMIEEKYLSNVWRILFVQITWNVMFRIKYIKRIIKQCICNIWTTRSSIFKFRNKPEIVSKKKKQSWDSVPKRWTDYILNR